MRANAFDRRCVKDKLAIWITIARVEGFAIARAPLYQFTALTLRTGDSCFIRLVDGFGVITFRVVTATHEHAKSPLTQNFVCATLRACMAFQHFNNVPISLTFQRANVIAGWIIYTPQKRAVFAGTYD